MTDAKKGTIDREPTWESLLAELVRRATSSKYLSEGGLAWAELRKMAKAADAYQALQKAGKVP